MRVIIPDHPLVAHKLSLLREKSTDSCAFRQLTNELTTLLAYEATSRLCVEPVLVQTPVASMTGMRLRKPDPLVVPILRAGVGLLEGMLQMLPFAEVGFLGMSRDEKTLKASMYADRIPKQLAGRHVFVLDPMLATGGTLVAAIETMLERGADDVTGICLLASIEGMSAVERAFSSRSVSVNIVTAAVDEGLDANGFILPGLGDAGDRLYGVV